MQIQYPLVSCVGVFLNWWDIKYRLKSHLERIWTHFLPDELWWLSSDLVCNMDLVLTSWAKWTQYSTVEHYGLSSHLVSYVNTPGEYKNSAFTWWALWTKHSPGDLSWLCPHSHLLSYVGSVLMVRLYWPISHPVSCVDSVLTWWAILAHFSHLLSYVGSVLPGELSGLGAYLISYVGSGQWHSCIL